MIFQIIIIEASLQFKPPGLQKAGHLLYKEYRQHEAVGIINMEHIGIYLKNIYLNNLKGQLVFRKGHVRKFLFFQDGFLIHARTNESKELLGEVLFRTGRISRETHAKLDALIEPKKSIGEILIEKNLISREDLKEGLEIQMREIILNMFPVFYADFNFENKDQFAQETFDVKIAIPTLIEDGIRRMKFDKQLKDMLKENRFRPKSKEFFFRLSEVEKDIYKKITEGGDPEAVFQIMDVQKEDYWKGLYLLVCLDLIEAFGEESDERKKAEWASQSDSRLKAVLKMYPKIGGMTYYQALDVTNNASPEEVKKAYFIAARQYHPDLFSRELDYEIKEKIDDVFDFITQAYQTLSDEKKREEYEQKRKKDTPIDQSDGRKKAEVQFRKGKTLYDQSRYKEALIFLEEAVRLDPNKANYFLLLALSQAKMEMYQRQAEKNFLKAIEISPWNAESFVGLGMMYKKAGLRVKAEKQFRKALSIDPDHRAAKRQLSEMKGKPGKKTLKEMLSKSIFSKKDK
jgi:curved DNA-binding protein CbpA